MLLHILSFAFLGFYNWYFFFHSPNKDICQDHSIDSSIYDKRSFSQLLDLDWSKGKHATYDFRL